MSNRFALEHLPASAATRYSISENIQRRRVYILPTREGLIFFLFLMTMLLGAVNYNNSMAYLLSFLLGSLYLVCILHTHRNLAGLIINCEDGRPVFCGEDARFPLIMDNRNFPQKPAIEIGQSPHYSLLKKNARDEVRDYSVDIKANTLTRFNLPVRTRSRGLIMPGRISIATRYPLGLFRAWSYVEINRRCLVYPRPSGKLPIPQSDDFEQQGSSGIKSGSDDFVGFRNYHHGDSIRKIAWKALSRELPLLVKRFSGDTGQILILGWDKVVHINDIESRLSQLSAWILQAEQRSLVYGLALPDKVVEPGQGEQHRHRCLAALATFGLGHAG